MIDDPSFLKKYDIKPFGYKKDNNAVIIKTKNERYVLKKRNKDQTDLFLYLKSRNFNHFPIYYNENEDDNYDLYEYIENYCLSDEERALELVNLTSVLHHKTTHYINVSLDDYKIIYEEIDEKLENLTIYYEEINNLIDKEIYMSPSNYLLARNMTKIHALLKFCKEELDNWYELIKNDTKKRVVLTHGNLDLSHLLRNENSYLISWDKSKIDMPIYDFYYFYKNNYKDLEFAYLLNAYESKYPFTDSERKLLFILISLPSKVAFNLSEYENTKLINELLYYIYKTDSIVSPYYSKEETKE